MKVPTNVKEYTALRTQLGTQQQVANMLGVHVITIAKRERNMLAISRETNLALAYVAEHQAELKA